MKTRSSLRYKAGTIPVPRFSVVMMLKCVMLLLLQLLRLSEAFNVDIDTAIVHEGKEGSMFGYAVAQHVDQSTNWLLIGAPRADTVQPGVEKGGTVFRCKTDLKNSCQEIPFDTTGNNVKYIKQTYRSTEEKSNQWFGSTIESSGENGVIVACAPRYVYFSRSGDKREPVGVCWVAKTSTTKYERYSPCAAEVDRSEYIDTYHRHGFCQFGMSATFTRDGRRLMIAAPGSWYWQGQIFNFKTSEGGRVFSQSSERNATYDNRYMGYASAIGKFDDDDSDDYVVGIPKGDLYLGRIEMYTQNMSLIGNLSGEQIGSYFGGALAVTDLNGDRLDDIIVGAPLYSDFDSKNFDTGRVYIFYQTNSKRFKPQKRDILDGKMSQSRFGMALSKIGDVNYDGYHDLCVGAPYAGENKLGAIYIYHGSKKGIITEASQIIYAEDIKSPLSAFGIAISGGIDQDNNFYPDMLVGAYESNKAVFLRTRPVVRVYASLKLDPENVDLDKRSCSLVDATRVTCLNIHSCLKYSGVGVPDELYFELSWTLDVKENNASTQEQRAYYLNQPKMFTEKKTFKIEKDNTFCTSSYAFVKNEISDKLSPIRASLNFDLIEDKNGKSRSRRDLRPVLDAYTPTSTSFTVQILKDCGLDNICIPDLSVTFIRIDTVHLIGSKDELEVLIIVANKGEDSFNTKLWIQLPPGVDYGSFAGERSTVSIACATLEKDDTIVVCDMGNPMIEGSESEFTLIFQPTDSNDTQDTLSFTLFVNSSNTENPDTYHDNQAVLDIPVKAETKIDLFGKADPELIILNTTDDTGVDKGRIVKHVFQLENDGRSATNETELQIRWPSHDVLGLPALVLEGPLIINGNGKCNVIIITPNNASNFGYNGEPGEVNLAAKRGKGKQKRDTNMEKIACTYQYCTIIQCLVGYMARYTRFILTVRSRIKVRDFIKMRKDTKMYHLVSVAYARVRSVPYDFKSVDQSRFPVKKLELSTKINTYHLKPSGKGFENWILIVAIAAGIFLLLLLILLLWWCGFFKRKKPEEEGYFVVNGKSDIDNKIVD